MSYLITDFPSRKTSSIFGSTILDFIISGGPSLDTEVNWKWQFSGVAINIYFSPRNSLERFPNIGGTVDGEFLAPPIEGMNGEILIYKTGREQGTLAHEMFHALQLVAFKADPNLVDRQRQLWRRSKFPPYIYAHSGGPDEGAAEVWMAHQGHLPEEEPGSLLVLEDEWAEYFNAVISHCW